MQAAPEPFPPAAANADLVNLDSSLCVEVTFWPIFCLQF